MTDRNETAKPQNPADRAKDDAAPNQTETAEQRKERERQEDIVRGPENPRQVR